METNYNPFEDLSNRLDSIENNQRAIIRLLEKNDPSAASEYGDIALAEEITGLARQTIYQLVSKRKIPFMKKSKKLYFSRTELLNWIKSGKKRTVDEIMGY
jgi:predicted DNA-binding transcriptional regulator AlpA